MKYIEIPEDKIPSCCAECFALDDSGDYCCCRITNDQKGYMFNQYLKRMDSCPLKIIDTYQIFKCGAQAAYQCNRKKRKKERK